MSRDLPPDEGKRTGDVGSAGDSARRLDAALARIGGPSGQGGTVFLKVMADAARIAAAAADRRQASNQSLGPLDGRIVSVKGLFDVAGEVTTAGSAALRVRTAADVDAVAVARIKQAGGVVIGRTHMTEFAFSAVGLNPHDGSPGNPHDRTRIPGGSSTGAAISVADGMAEVALASDTGGSIRIPAALCGVVGFKPTSGAIPTRGAFPLSPTLDVFGPIARDVASCAVADAVLRGVEAEPLPPLSLSDVVLTVVRVRLCDDAEPAVKDAVDAALGRLRRGGASLRDDSLEAELDQLSALDRIGSFTGPELLATLTDLGIDDLADVDSRTRLRIEVSRHLPAVDYVRMHRSRAIMIATVDARLARGEILLLPTVPLTAPAIAAMDDPEEFQRVNGLLLRNTRVANLFDLPAISLPVPVHGLPVGLMLMARRGSDRRLLAVAASVEEALIGSMK